MTKEEALAPHIKMSDASTYWVYAEDAKKAMDEYAKQQAIAFFKFCLPGPTDFEPHVSKRYDQFIEQQNKL